ncbi:SpaH/EbpB family LPXTG-anchored major pilin, partial [Pseudolysinimonas sp.]|uniref:SpaH/EbpB family LPXTG-anchored major pilin n=1 Tax=Pseudolysinimonas sp. TaxID=2680009 RepID=UPI00286BDD49
FSASSASKSPSMSAAENSLTSQAGVTLGSDTIAVTDVTGTATFGSLGYGLYLVQETNGPATITDPAKPFLVTVPFPTGPANATNPNEWLYTVHVYPKNAVVGLDKVVNSGDAGFFTAGDYVSWTVTVDLPVLPSGENLTTVVLTDTIDTADLAFVTTGIPAGISPRSISVFDSAGDPTASTFVETTHFVYNIAGGVQTVTFTAAGRALLEAEAQGGTIEFVVPTQIVTLPAGGLVTNDVNSVVNSSSLDADATQGFGQLRVLKYSETDVADTPTDVPLAGARFELYHDLDNDGVLDVGEPQVVVDGADEWVSGTNGELDIEALKPGNYLLVEIEAPVGYQTLGTAAPIDVTIVVGETDAASVNYSAVENLQLPPFALPFTGSNGVVTFGIIGTALTALGIWLAVITRRRRARA